MAVLLTRGPLAVESAIGIELAGAAADRGIGVEVFLMAEGAELLATPDVGALRRPGIRLVACTQSVVTRGLATDLPDVDYASQFQLAGIVSRADRLVSL